MRVTKFEDLVVWQKARDLAVMIYRATSHGRFARDAGLCGQIQRAAVPVKSNIAEGFDRYSRAEFRQFLSIARGSASEIRNYLHLAQALGYIPEEDHRLPVSHCMEVSRMTAALRSSLNRR